MIDRAREEILVSLEAERSPLLLKAAADLRRYAEIIRDTPQVGAEQTIKRETDAGVWRQGAAVLRREGPHPDVGSRLKCPAGGRVVHTQLKSIQSVLVQGLGRHHQHLLAAGPLMQAQFYLRFHLKTAAHGGRSDGVLKIQGKRRVHRHAAGVDVAGFHHGSGDIVFGYIPDPAQDQCCAHCHYRQKGDEHDHCIFSIHYILSPYILSLLITVINHPLFAACHLLCCVLSYHITILFAIIRPPKSRYRSTRQLIINRKRAGGLGQLLCVKVNIRRTSGVREIRLRAGFSGWPGYPRRWGYNHPFCRHGTSHRPPDRNSRCR